MRTRIGLAVLALLAVSCSENENTGMPETPVNAKAIKLGQTVQGVTRAVVGPGSDVTATVLMCDGETADWTSYAAVKDNTIANSVLTTRATSSTASFKAGTGLSMSLQPTLYYNLDKSTKSWLTAVAPDGTLAASGTIVSMKNVDGQQDVMWAKAVSAGSETAPEATINLSFEHLTTQLNFAMKLTSVASGEWAGKTVMVKGISIQNSQLPKSVKADDGTIDWSSAASLVVPNISNASLAATASNVGNPVMVKGEGKVVVDVTLLVAEKELTITNVTIKNTSTAEDLTTATGSAHLITLNVAEPEKPGEAVGITATATVAPWKAGAAGSADLK